MHILGCLFALAVVASAVGSEIEEHHFNNTQEKHADVAETQKEDVVTKEDAVEDKLEEISRTPHGEQDPGKRRKKSATTTFCVEIRPSGAETKPFQICETPDQQKPQPQPQHYQTYEPQPAYHQQYQPYQQQSRPKAQPMDMPQDASMKTGPAFGGNIPVKVFAPMPAPASGPKPYNAHYRHAKDDETDETSAAKGSKMVSISSRSKDTSEQKEEHESHRREDSAQKSRSAYGEQYIPATSYIPMAHSRPNRPPSHHSGHNGLVITCQPNLAGYAHNVPSNVHHPPATTYYRSSTSRSYGPYGRPHAPVRPVYGYYPPQPQPQQQQEPKILQPSQPTFAVPQQQPQRVLPQQQQQQQQQMFGIMQQQTQGVQVAPGPSFSEMAQNTELVAPLPVRKIPSPIPQAPPQSQYRPPQPSYPQPQPSYPAPQPSYPEPSPPQPTPPPSYPTPAPPTQPPSYPVPSPPTQPPSYPAPSPPSYPVPSPPRPTPPPAYPAPQPTYPMPSPPRPQPPPTYVPQPQQPSYVQPAMYREAEQHTQTEEKHSAKESHTIKKMEEVSKERAVGTQWAKDMGVEKSTGKPADVVSQWNPVMRTADQEMRSPGDHGSGHTDERSMKSNGERDMGATAEHRSDHPEDVRKASDSMGQQFWRSEDTANPKENEVAHN